jgi:DNA polymerase III alpha subunit
MIQRDEKFTCFQRKFVSFLSENIVDNINILDNLAYLWRLLKTNYGVNKIDLEELFRLDMYRYMSWTFLWKEYSDTELMSRELSTFGYYVTNHPSSKYQDGIMKIQDIKKYFDKYVDTVVIIGSIRKIKTKKAEDMGFISGSDETGTADFIIFPKNNKFLTQFKKDNFVKIRGQVTRRNDKYQIVVSNIELID